MKKLDCFKRILAFVGVAAMTATLVSCNIGSKNSSKDEEELVVGFDDTFVPMGFKDDNGEIVGFDVELATEVSKKIDKKVKFQPIDWSMKETELSNGNIDLIWNGYSVTDERKEAVNFSNIYLENRQVIITLVDSSIKTKADLKGKKVGAQNQSSSVDAVNEEADVLASFDGGKLFTYETNNDALMDLESGRIDAVVADEILARYYINARGEEKYKLLDEDFGDESYAVGVSKDNKELLDDINKGLKEVIDDGTAGEISKKWFGEDIVVK